MTSQLFHLTPPVRHRARFRLQDCNRMLPLVRSVAHEIVDRRIEFKQVRAALAKLDAAHTPEGLTVAKADLEARLLELEDGMLTACTELKRAGIDVRRLSPLVVHFPGRNDNGPTVFCWKEGEAAVCCQHPVDFDDDYACVEDRALASAG